VSPRDLDLETRIARLSKTEKLKIVDEAQRLANKRRLEQQFASENVPQEKASPCPPNGHLPRKHYRQFREQRGDELRVVSTGDENGSSARSDAGSAEAPPEQRPHPEVLWFDPDVARKFGVKAALWIKNVELRVRKKLQKKGSNETSVSVWDTREAIAATLGLTISQLRTAQDKALGVVGLRKDHDNPTDHTLFARFLRQNKFLKSREKVTPWSVRVNEMQESGDCAAVLLQMLRTFIREMIGNGHEPDAEGYFWHYDSMADLVLLYKGIFSHQQIKSAVAQLVKREVILRRHKNPKNKRDPRRAYALCKQFQADLLAQSKLDDGGGSEIANHRFKNRKSPGQESQIPNTETLLPKSVSLLAGARNDPDQPHTQNTPETTPSGCFPRLTAGHRLRSLEETGVTSEEDQNQEGIQSQGTNREGGHQIGFQNGWDDSFQKSKLLESTRDQRHEVQENCPGVAGYSNDDIFQKIIIGADSRKIFAIRQEMEIPGLSPVIRPEGSPLCYGSGEHFPDSAGLPCQTCSWKSSCWKVVPLDSKVRRALAFSEAEAKRPCQGKLTRGLIMEAYREVHLQIYTRLPKNPIGTTDTITRNVRRLGCGLRTYFFLSLVSYRDRHLIDEAVWDSWFGSRAETNAVNAYESALEGQCHCLDTTGLAILVGVPKDDHGKFKWSEYRTAHDLPWEAWKQRFAKYQASEADIKALLDFCQSDWDKGAYAAEEIHRLASKGLLPDGLSLADVFGDYHECLLKIRRLLGAMIESSGHDSGTAET
jgi:hypothetical protein